MEKKKKIWWRVPPTEKYFQIKSMFTMPSACYMKEKCWSWLLWVALGLQQQIPDCTCCFLNTSIPGWRLCKGSHFTLPGMLWTAARAAEEMLVAMSSSEAILSALVNTHHQSGGFAVMYETTGEPRNANSLSLLVECGSVGTGNDICILSGIITAASRHDTCNSLLLCAVEL